MEYCLTEEAEQERDLAYLEAFTLGREPPRRPTIQDLEKYATAWADLVPNNPRAQAALAHTFSERYHFTQAHVPGIRQALGLDGEQVAREYTRLYRAPLQSIYAREISPLARARWSAARLSHRLEALPPFWTAFSLTLTETVGAGIMGLPIGIAQLGLIPGLILLVIFGAVNIVTIACISEAVARSGTIRYGETYIGKLVEDYLGAFASAVTSAILVMLTALVLVVYYVGVSTTLDKTIHIPALLGTALIFGFGMILVSRESLSATVSSALIIGSVNMLMILIMCALALPHLQAENLTYVHVPFIRGVPFESAILASIFGIILAAYFGHLSMGNCARVVLRRDPSARSFMFGGMAAQAAAMVFYCLWVFSINGALRPQSLAGQYSTTLVPLTQLIGPVVILVGTIYVVLAMGMASVSFSLSLRNLVRERLPHTSTRILALPRQTGTLVFRPQNRERGLKGRAATRLGLTYLGIQRGQPRFRLVLNTGASSVQRMVTAVRTWSIADAPDLAPSSSQLDFEVVEAQDDIVTLRVSSAWRMSVEGDWVAEGARVTDILEMDEPLRRLMQWVLRQGQVSIADVAAHVSQSESDAQVLVGQLVEQGLLEVVEGAPELRYRAHLARKRSRASGLPDDIWSKLDGTDQPRPDVENRAFRRSPVRARLDRILATDRGRNIISLAPVALMFCMTEWLLSNNGVTFAGVLNLVGIIAISVFAGMFPTLLLVASRRKGDYVPQMVFRILGWPPIVIGVYLLFLANLFIHGLIIWQQPFERGAALGVGILIVVTTLVMMRRGAFNTRVIIELFTDDVSKDTSWRVTVAGRPLPVRALADSEGGRVEVEAASGTLPPINVLRSATFHLPPTPGSELKVWVHRVTPEDTSESLPAAVSVSGHQTPVDLQLTGGQVILPLAQIPPSVGITIKGRVSDPSRPSIHVPD
jgi:amino acid permease